MPRKWQQGFERRKKWQQSGSNLLTFNPAPGAPELQKTQ